MSEDTNFYKGALARRDMDQQYSEGMTLGERVIALRLIALTLDWGKTTYSISWDRLLNGCEIGDVHYTSLGITSRQAQVHVKGLVAKKFCHVSEERYHNGAIGKIYTVRADWDEDNHKWEWQMVKVDLPKRIRNKFLTPKQEFPDPQEEISDRDTSTETSTETRSNPTDVELPPTQVLREKVKQHTGSISKSPSRPRRLNFEGILRQSVKDAHNHISVRPFTRKERNQVRSCLTKEWEEPAALSEFLSWAATNWSSIIRSEFKWMKDNPPPQTPDIGFLCGMRTHFYEAWATRERRFWINQEDWDSVHRMMEIHGCTEEVALEKITQEKSRRVGSKAMSEREQDVARRERSLEKAKEALRRDERQLGKHLADKEDELEKRRLQEGGQSKSLHKTTKPVYNAYEDPDHTLPDQEELPEYEAEPYEE